MSCDIQAVLDNAAVAFSTISLECRPHREAAAAAGAFRPDGSQGRPRVIFRGQVVGRVTEGARHQDVVTDKGVAGIIGHVKPLVAVHGEGVRLFKTLDQVLGPG